MRGRKRAVLEGGEKKVRSWRGRTEGAVVGGWGRKEGGPVGGGRAEGSGVGGRRTGKKTGGGGAKKKQKKTKKNGNGLDMI